MPGDAPARCRRAACHGDLLLVADLEARLQVQVSLKSSHVSAHDHRRGGAPQRRRRFRAAVLRGTRADQLRARGAGHRRYPRPVLRRIAFIVYAQRVGLTLEEIGLELAKLPADRAPTRHDWSRLSRQWSVRIDERIAELQRLKSGLTKCIGCGCLSLDRCRLANPDDHAADRGPGPRYWIGDPPAGPSLPHETSSPPR
jgi:MerR family redox-sensitive transcriptional activator SoxR